MFEVVAYADSLDDLLYKLNAKILNPVIEFAFIIALVVFLFGVMEFLRNQENEEKRTKGKQHMLWGIIGFLIMFGVFGIMQLLVNTLGLGNLKTDPKDQGFTPPPIQELKVPNPKK